MKRRSFRERANANLPDRAGGGEQYLQTRRSNPGEDGSARHHEGFSLTIEDNGRAFDPNRKAVAGVWQICWHVRA